jgi:hypothetical protein
VFPTWPGTLGIAAAIKGKTAAAYNYIGKRANGGVFSGVVLTIG